MAKMRRPDVFHGSAKVAAVTVEFAPKLVHSDTRKPVKVGEKLTDFRGNGGWKVTGWQEPLHSGSTGRVNVVKGRGGEQQFYPGVFNLEWEGR